MKRRTNAPTSRPLPTRAWFECAGEEASSLMLGLDEVGRAITRETLFEAFLARASQKTETLTPWRRAFRRIVTLTRSNAVYPQKKHARLIASAPGPLSSFEKQAVAHAQALIDAPTPHRKIVLRRNLARFLSGEPL